MNRKRLGIVTSNYIPKICPLGGESSIVKCVQCNYFEQSKWANLTWCRMDRIKRGLPEMK